MVIFQSPMIVHHSHYPFSKPTLHILACSHATLLSTKVCISGICFLTVTIRITSRKKIFFSLSCKSLPYGWFRLSKARVVCLSCLGLGFPYTFLILYNTAIIWSLSSHYRRQEPRLPIPTSTFQAFPWIHRYDRWTGLFIRENFD